MLGFAEEFFAAEVREDFMVDETMKTVWAAELEVLQEIAVICDRHHLKWYAGYGTLLGAVRHGGFVPWDDDMDILMLREDYMKLLHVMPKELPEGYLVRSCFHDGYGEYNATVFNANSISTSPERLRRFHGCPFAVGVDIFPLDYLPRDQGERSALKALLALTILPAIWLKKEESREEKREDIEKGLKALEEFYKCKLDRTWIDEKPLMLGSFLQKKSNEVAMSYHEEDGDELVMWPHYWKKNDMVFRKEWFSDVTPLPFEEFMVPAPGGYDAVLKAMYGDYMVRRKGTADHDYPWYKDQLEQLRERLARMEELYAKNT